MSRKVDPEMIASSRLNQLVNPGFRVWQRGTSFSSMTAGYTADKWEVLSGTLDVQQSSDAKYGQFALLAEDVDSGVQSMLEQYVEDVAVLQGETVTLGIWVKAGPTSPATEATVRVEDTDGSNVDGAEETVSLGSTWEFVTATYTVQQDATELRIQLFPATTAGDGSSTGEAIFDGAVLVAGSEPVDYPQVVRPIGQEQSLCERYYETFTTNLGGSTEWYFLNNVGAAPVYMDVMESHSQTKSAVPTLMAQLNEISTVTDHDGNTFGSEPDTSSWSVSSGAFRSSLDKSVFVFERSVGVQGAEIARLDADMEAEVT